MKLIFMLACLLLITNISCKKKNDECQAVTIVMVGTGTGCAAWAINVKGVNYISDNIPDQFKMDGRVVCAKFELYEDLRLCVCCGGTRANIKSMK